MNITKPTPIQALAIEPVLNGKDVIAKAETGTGKTLAFGAPMISKIDSDRVTVLGLVLCPTRELAEQVAVVLEKLGAPRDIKVALIVGGEPAGPQVAALQAGAQVVVGTPGRVIDLYEQKFLSFPWTEFVVLDEADEMLEIGFIDDVKKIMRFTPDERQTLLFSATFPDTLLRLARDHTREPAEIATASGVKTVDNIRQEFITLDSDDKALALIRMIERSEEDDVFLIFCERRTDVERLMRRLERLPFPIKALHGGYDQSARFRVMSSFRTGEVKALVATDVASRGLDVHHVTWVVNYDVPRSITDYTHRIGRTGRAGRDGRATTLVTHENMHRWKLLLRDATWEIEQIEPPGARPRRERADRPERSRDREERRPRGGRDEGRREGGRREAGPRDEDRPRRSRRPRQAVEHADAPVSLPTDRPVRSRGPNDPPRRARLSPEMHERLDQAEDDAPRSGGGRERRDGSEGKPSGRGERSRRRGGRRRHGERPEKKERSKKEERATEQPRPRREDRDREQSKEPRSKQSRDPRAKESPGGGFGAGV